MSLVVKISSKDRATGRFMSRVHRALIKAIKKAKEDRDITQVQIAEAMGVDKSVVTRILNGEGNLTLKTIGDVAWAVGLRPEIAFLPVETPTSLTANHPAMVGVIVSGVEVPRQETTKPISISLGRAVTGNQSNQAGYLLPQAKLGSAYVN